MKTREIFSHTVGAGLPPTVYGFSACASSSVYCMYVCMIAFVLVALTSILQAYAVIEMVPFALGTSIILLIICWFMELIGGILIIIYGVEQSPALTNSLDTVFFRLIYDYDINPRSSRILTIIQEYVSRKTSTRFSAITIFVIIEIYE